ncbi:hypothetical protein ILUMI_26003, partial [Ignelater luminosus]
LDSSIASPLNIHAPRVIGGSDAKRHEFPYMVSIHPLTTEEHTCGGSIISSIWILTAAHCCLQSHANGAKDIPLIELITPLRFTDDAVKPIALPLANETFASGWLTSWGISRRLWFYPVTLQRLEMIIVTNEECKKALTRFKYFYQYPLLDIMVCSLPLYKGLEAGCSGDSGSPIAHEGVIISVQSWSVACVIPKFNAPTVFTAVSK